MSGGAPTTFMEEDSAADRESRSLIYLLRFARPFWLSFAAGFLLLLLSSISAILSARTLGAFVEDGLLVADREKALWLGGVIIALELFAIALVYLGRRQLASAAAAAILEIRRSLFARLEELPLSYFDRQPLGRTVTRMTHDVESMDSFFSSSLGKVAMSVIMFFSCIVAMIVTSPALGAAVACGMIPAAVVAFYGRIPTRVLNRDLARKNSAVNATLSEFLNGIGVIRGFALEAWSLERYDRTVRDHLDAGIRLNLLNSWLRPLILLLCNAPLLLLIWIGGGKVLAGTMGVGLFVTFVRYCDRFARPIAELAYEIHFIQQALASTERVTAFLNAASEEHELGSDGELDPGRLKGSIEFSGVSMEYRPGEQALRDLGFRVEPGQKVGLAGATGSGKSTTVSLIARLYEFQEGKILIDGYDIRSLDRSALRRQIGFVSQDVIVFRGTLRQNLALGRGTADAEIREACDATGLSEVCARRALTLDSEVLDQGSNLSHGERQLIALTRVIIADPAILVMDEATANIDPRMEETIHRAVDRLMSGRTCLIIAHRLQTLASCEKLLIFRSGKVVEEGSHPELLARGGYYADLWHNAVQSGEERIDPDPAIGQ